MSTWQCVQTTSVISAPRSTAPLLLSFYSALVSHPSSSSSAQTPPPPPQDPRFVISVGTRCDGRYLHYTALYWHAPLMTFHPFQHAARLRIARKGKRAVTSAVDGLCSIGGRSSSSETKNDQTDERKVFLLFVFLGKYIKIYAHLVHPGRRILIASTRSPVIV